LLMIAGSDNVMAFNPETRQTVSFGTTFWADTCRFAETTPLRLPDGAWLFGAEQGAFLATPHHLYSRGYVPPVVFTTLAVNGTSETFCLPACDRIRLRADQRNATIGFAALDYTDNSGILYRTRVDGSPWTNAGHSRSVTLFNLSPGDHLLEAQSTDRYGRWVDNTRSIAIYVAPYWHETWWAALLFALLAASVAGGAVYTVVYVRRVNRHRRELLEKYMALIRRQESATEPVGREPAPAAEPSQAENVVSREAAPRPEDTPMLRRVRRYIEENISNPDANVDDMALAAAASRSTLNRHLRSQLGVSAAQLLTEARLRRAEQLLKERPDLAVADIASMCGYSDPQYFQRVFKTKRGVPAASLRQLPDSAPADQG
ncbi:MAG: helix-turn-helix domain-containing protein, partial [Muribaculaceae bacterium]|nr:helix-turn-helix domain-containing protein [Muribaculaceae bacterium]